MQAQVLTTASQLDFSRHAVIEASAGTGKTYTLIELVMRCLTEQRLRLDQLLLVTFTEKATAELRSRIRQRMTDELNKDHLAADVRQHLKYELAAVHQAPIQTLHGFCHGVLQEHAFEQGMPFEREVVEDKQVYQQVLTQMKRHWVTDEALQQALRTQLKTMSLSKLEALLMDLAAVYDPAFDVLAEEDEACSANGLLKLIGTIQIPSETQVLEEVEQLQVMQPAKRKAYWDTVYEPLTASFKAIKKQQSLSELTEWLNNTFGDILNNEAVGKQLFKGSPKVYGDDQIADSRSLAPELLLFYDQLNELLKQWHKHRNQLIPILLSDLKARAAAWKKSQGQISFDDMIGLLWQQLAAEQLLPETEQLLSELLRNRYRVVMIDEFQDTSRHQWLIFQHLFLHDPQRRHQLLVIGDPKQAIYGFRGADLHTYHQAVNTMLDRHHAKAYRLGVNYRTTPGLIEHLNRFFSDRQGAGWFTHEGVAVRAPEREVTRAKGGPELLENPSGLAELCCIETSEDGSAELMKQDLARQMVNVMADQLLGQVRILHKEKKRMLEPADICVLIRSAGDAVYLEEALKARGLAFVIHKKKDLYESREATEYQVLLTALSQPQRHQRLNNALITVFFNLKPEQLDDFAEERLPRAQQHWLTLNELAAGKDWVGLFHYLLHEMGTLERVAGDSRRRTNLLHIRQQLLEAALRQNLTAAGLLHVLLQKKQLRQEADGLHQKDTEASAVRLMTKHISKGLEFPVVFLFGGFGSAASQDRFYRYYDAEQHKKVFEISKVSEQAHQQAQLEEDRRLYYVAMTRAVFMLFLPFHPYKPDDSQLGGYGRTVMARIDDLGLPRQSFDSAKQATDPPVCAESADEQSVHSLELKAPDVITNTRRQLYSFSSLSQFRQATATHSEGFVSELTAELQSATTAEVLAGSQTQRQQVPGGVKTGHVLHGIFEHLDFSLTLAHEHPVTLQDDAGLMAVVDQQMQQFRLDNLPLKDESGQPYSDVRSELAAWVWHTLRKPLAALDGGQLADVPVGSRQHELAFFWQRNGVNLTGFIDLLFAVPGEQGADYFILDWKSNLSPQGYAPEVLNQQVMKEHQYHWQYQLYAMAMADWFKQINIPQARLKGALYLFSRGIRADETAANGVFYDEFSQSDWQLPEVAADLLSLAAGGRWR